MASDVETKVKFTADTDEAQASIGELDTALSHTQETAEATGKELDQIGDVEVDVNDSAIESARRRIDELRDEIRRQFEMDVDADVRPAQRQIAQLKSAIKALQADKPKVEVDADADKAVRELKRVEEAAHDVGHGGAEGMGTFREEAADTAREAAASFDGSAQSIQDIFQEVGANAFAGFGPAGMAAGIAAAAGLGLVTSKLQEAADHANQLGDDVAALAGELYDAGGSLDDEQVTAKIKEWALAIDDTRSMWELWQKRSTTNMELVVKAAKEVGVSTEDMLAAMSGTDADKATAAIEQMTRKRDQLAQAQAEGAGAYQDEIDVLNSSIDKAKEANFITEEGTNVSKELTEATKSRAEAAARAAQAEEETAAATQWAAEETAKYEAAVQAVTDTYTSGMGVADEYAAAQQRVGDKAKVTTKVLLEESLKQTQAQLDWSKNMGQLAAKVPADVLAELQKLGPQGAQQVALLNSMTAAELQKWVTNQQVQGAAAALALLDPVRQKSPEIVAAYALLGKSSTKAYADGMLSQSAQAAEAARAVLAAAQGQLTAGLRVQLGLDTTEFYQKLSQAKIDAKQRALELNDIIANAGRPTR